MRVYDLTHTIHKDMTVYPGDEKPEIESVFTIITHGVAEKKITLLTHTGTHMDAPAHMIDGGKTLDAFKPEDFIGDALVIDVTHLSERIGFEDVLPYGPWLQDVKYVFFKTGWSEHWGTDAYLKGFPVLTKKAANWLCEQRIRAVGIDALSIDCVEDDEYPVHRILLGCEMLIIENLTNLEALPERAFKVACLPVKIEGADGAPARVMAMVE